MLVCRCSHFALVGISFTVLCFLVISRLTKAEKQNLEYQKQLLALAKQHKKAADLEKVNRFHMPKDNEVFGFTWYFNIFICMVFVLVILASVCSASLFQLIGGNVSWWPVWPPVSWVDSLAEILKKSLLLVGVFTDAGERILKTLP